MEVFSGDASFLEVISQIPRAVVLTDTVGRITWANSSFQELCGYKLEEMLGQRPGQFLQGPETDPVAIKQLREARENVESRSVDILNYHKDGHSYTARVSLSPLHDRTGVHSGFIALAEDISPDASEQMVYMSEQNRLTMTGNAIRMVVHQWKQPLNVISLVNAYTSELVPKKIPESSQLLENCDMIEKQLLFLSDTLENFRNFLKPILKKEVFYACDVARQVKAMFKDVYEESHCELVLPEDNNCLVFGYPSEFIQVLMNLFSNSLDAMQERNIENKRIVFSAALVNGRNIMSIRDNAGGIPEDLLPERLFYFNMTTKGERGTGIGLYICKSIIEDRMGGKIWAQNIEGGAEVIIELPLPSELE